MKNILKVWLGMFYSVQNRKTKINGLILMACVLFLVSCSGEVRLYVAPDGDDNHVGTQSKRGTVRVRYATDIRVRYWSQKQPIDEK
jgi:hypothetical protein